MSENERQPDLSAIENPMTETEIYATLEAILSNSLFAESPRLRDFLRFIVEQTLAGSERSLKEYVIGTEVFGRNANFDPRVDSIVRAHAGRLRKKLDEFYQAQPDERLVMISLPKGHYVPQFGRRSATASFHDNQAVEQTSTIVPLETALPVPTEINPRPYPNEPRRVTWLLAAAVIAGIMLGWLAISLVSQVNPAIKEISALASAPLNRGVQAGQVAVPVMVDGRREAAWEGRMQQEAGKLIETETDSLASAQLPSAPRFGVLWDETNLYLMVEVAAQAGSVLTGQDSIEVFLDTHNDQQHSYQADDFHFTLQGGSPTELHGRIARVKVASQAEPWGYRVEASIPWATLNLNGEAGRTVGFDLGFQRRGANKIQQLWHGSAENAFDTSGFGSLTLSSELINAAKMEVFPAGFQSVALTGQSVPLTGQSIPLNDAGSLRVARDGDSESWVAARFPLPKLEARILAARLRLYCAAASPAAQGQVIKVNGALADHAEANLWPGNLSNGAIFQSALRVASQSNWYQWDVTPVVKQAYAQGHKAIDLAVIYQGMEGSSGWVEFKALRAHGFEPRLVLEY